MKSKKDVEEFCEYLTGRRMTVKELEQLLQAFLLTKNKLEVADDDEFDDVDYRFIITDAREQMQTHGFIDLDIYYLKTRVKNGILITEASILDYQY